MGKVLYVTMYSIWSLQLIMRITTMTRTRSHFTYSCKFITCIVVTKLMINNHE